MSSSRSIWVGPEAVEEILAFVQLHPKGIAVETLAVKYDLISEQTLLAALSILQSDGKIAVEHERTVYPVNSNATPD
jgi:hypothetical protein